MAIIFAMNESTSLAWRLMWSRKQSHLTQKELQEASGISGTYISDIERGKITNVGIEIIRALADALEVDIAYLLGLQDYPLEDSGHLEEQQSRQNNRSIAETDRKFGYELLALFETLPKDDQAFILDLARRLKRGDTPRIIGDE